MALSGIGPNQQASPFGNSPTANHKAAGKSARLFGASNGGAQTYNVNPEDFIEPGMNITGGWDDKKKIVDVSDDIRDKLVSLVKNEYLTADGMTDGEERSALIRDYLKNIPADDKLSVSHTLEQIYLGEAERVRDAIQGADPGWQPGQPIDPEILAGVFAKNSGSSLDVIG